MGELADIIDLVGRNTKGQSIVSFGQDRLDADVQGSVALFDLILKTNYGSGSVCFYSKQVAFSMCKMIANLLPGLFVRAEHTPDLAAIIGKSPSIWVWDTTNFSQMSAFDAVLQSSSFRHGSKRIYMIDHHKDNNEGKATGSSPSDYGQHVRVYRYEIGANTSIVLAAMRELGVELCKDNPDHQARAIAAWLAIDVDTQGFNEQFLTDYDYCAIDYLERVLCVTSMEQIDFIKKNVPASWRSVEMKLRGYAQEHRFSPTAVYGAGVIEDFGIFPHAADYLLGLGYETCIVFGILRDWEGGSQIVTLNGSGRTCINEDLDLPSRFGKIFYEESEGGVRKALGGGRESDDGRCAMCAGEEPLYHLNSADLSFLMHEAWPQYASILAERIRQHVPCTGSIIIEK